MKGQRGLAALGVALAMLLSQPAAAQSGGEWLTLEEAQRSVPALAKRITIELNAVTVAQAVRTIAQQAELSVGFQQQLPDLDRPVSVELRNLPVARALSRVLAGTGLELLVSPTGQMVLREMQAAGTPGVVYGRVTDEAGAPLAGSLVSLIPVASGGTRRGVLSDVQGSYRILNVAPGEYQLEIRRIGYHGDPIPLTVREGATHRRDAQLKLAAVTLEAVQANASRDENRERARFESEAGVTARVVGGDQIKILPGLAEADVIRAMEVLPGVVSTSDFSSAFNVRGASADQNLILIDGFPVYNPFHFGGLFSVFNSDAVARAELQAGGFGVEHGGRVSSVLNVESRLEPTNRVSSDAGLSLIASRVMVRGPLTWGDGESRGSFFASARRSYLDQLARANDEIPPYYLADFQGGVRIRTARGGRVTLIGYTGRDVLNYRGQAPGDTTSSPFGGDAIDWRWGNDVLGVHWQQPLPKAWLLDYRVSKSTFTDHLRLPDVVNLHYGSDVTHDMSRLDLRRDLSPFATLRLGTELSKIEAENVLALSGSVLVNRKGSGMLSSSWSGLQWRPGHRWVIDTGLRLDAWMSNDDAPAGQSPPSGGAQPTHDGKANRVTLAPRFAAKRFFGRDHDGAVKVAVGRYAQFVHSIRDEEVPLSNDTWVVADRNVPHVVSDQVQGGVEKFWGDTWYASMEAYHRHFRGVIADNPISNGNHPADDVLVGTGRSYGMDLLLRRSAGRVRGWTTISLLRATRTFPDPLTAGIDGKLPEVTYPPIFDRRIDADFVLEYEVPGGFEAGARWNFGSGVPYTPPSAQYRRLEYDLTTGRYALSGDTTAGTLPGARNGARYPAYHRLDLTLRRTYTKRWGSWTPYVQVLNVYNRKNVMFYEFDYGDTPARRKGFTQFPILPTIGAEATFR